MPPAVGLDAHTLVPYTIWGDIPRDHPAEERDIASDDGAPAGDSTCEVVAEPGLVHVTCLKAFVY